jgi:thiamine pyrophosphokinase
MLDKILPLIYPINEYDIILANGEFPKHTYLHGLILKAKNIICCDGATDKLLQHRIEPSYIIGDCDSLSNEIHQKYRDRLTIIRTQSSNDLSKALNFAKSILKSKHIIILGATGLREDHAIGNIATLTKYSNSFKTIAMISDYGMFSVHTGRSILKTIAGEQISFFTQYPDNQISCPELKWPLIKLKLPYWNNGTLNEATGATLTLTVSCATIVYRSFELKTIDAVFDDDNNKQKQYLIKPA